MGKTLKERKENAEYRRDIQRAKYEGAQFAAAYEIIDTKQRRKREQPKVEMKDEDRLIIERDRLKIIGSARDLFRNFSQAKGMIRQILYNVVWTGPEVNFNTTNEEWNTKAETWFNKTWARQADGRGRRELGRMVSTAYLSMIRDGDILCWFDSAGVVDGDRSKGRLFWWEADQMPTLNEAEWKQLAKKEPRFQDATNDGKPMQQYQGLVLDKWGRVHWYVVDSKRGRDRVKVSEVTFLPAEQCWLLNFPHSINQNRGLSELATPAPELQDIKEMRGHELQSGKANASRAMYVTREDPLTEALSRSDTPEVGVESPQVEGRNLDRFEKMTGGMIEYGVKGETVTLLENKRPSVSVKDFFDFTAGEAGMAMDLPRLFSRLQALASFSAARAEMNIADVTFGFRQNDLAVGFYRYLVEKATQHGIDTKALPANEEWQDAFEFTFKKLRPIDSTREAKAVKEELKAGLKDLSEVLGPKWRDKLKRLSDQKKEAARLGLNLDIFPPTKTPGTNGDPQLTPEEVAEMLLQEAEAQT